MKPTPSSLADTVSLLASGAHPDNIEFGCEPDNIWPVLIGF